MAQYEMNLRDYWLIVRRRRMIIIVCTVLVATFSFWFARQKVPQYTATAAVKFEQSTTLSGLLVEVFAVSSADNIETQVSLIKSYPVLEEVARRMGKLPQTASGEAVRESRAYQASLDHLGGKIKASRVPSTSIIEIAVTSPNPREAKEIANTVAEAYRDYNKANRSCRPSTAGYGRCGRRCAARCRPRWPRSAPVRRSSTARWASCSRRTARSPRPSCPCSGCSATPR